MSVPVGGDINVRKPSSRLLKQGMLTLNVAGPIYFANVEGEVGDKADGSLWYVEYISPITINGL